MSEASMYFIANWKMQLSVRESVNLAKKIKNGLKSVLSVKKKSVGIVLCPSFDSLESVFEAVKKSKAEMGVQDMFYKERGQFTGEESPLNLKELGVKYAILGHSERRKLGETDEDVRKKLVMALETGIFPIVCVGETLAERKSGKTKNIITKQVAAIFKNIKLGAKKVIIAYEPVWAIGTGIPAHPRDAAEARDLIFKLLGEYFKKAELKRIIVIYGGSVDSKNISGFLSKGKMEGALIGGSSLNAEEFIKIVKICRA
jgi:triosephosphate isomerase